MRTRGHAAAAALDVARARRVSATALALSLATLLVVGCRDGAGASEVVHRASVADGLAAGYSNRGARHVRTLVGLQDPESVRYDPQQDVYFVSNIAGYGSLEDGNGYIVRVRAGDLGTPELFVRSGANGALLNAPMGLVLQGDTLWVTDIDVVRGFHRVTGAPVATIDLSAYRPSRLNDIAAAPDGTLRVTDTGILMVYEGIIATGTDRIFEIAPGRSVSVVGAGKGLHQPNGIAWDSSAGRWLVVAFDPFAGDVFATRPGRTPTRQMLRSGRGRLDGVEPMPDGSIIFSSWSDSSIHVLRGGKDVQVIREVPEPADIGIDTRRNRVAIPLTVLGQVQVWDLPRP